MNNSTYELEWRGARKSGYSYADIEEALISGDLHSLYKIHVNGRRVVLRDFLEQERVQQAQAARVAAAQAAPQLRPEPPIPSLHAAPPPPLERAMPPGSPYSGSRASSRPAQKPVWFWPTVILSSTVCLLLMVVLGYIVSTSRSGNQHAASAGAPASTTKPAPAAAGTSEAAHASPAVASVSGIPEKPATPESKPDKKPVELKFHPHSITGNEIFPSAIVSTATVDWNDEEESAEDKKTEDDEELRKHQTPLYGDENSWLSFYLEGVKSGAQVTVEVSADGFIKPSKWQGTVTKVGDDGRVIIRPKVMWNYETLIKVYQQRPMNVLFSASVDGTELPNNNETYTLRSINDCPLSVLRQDRRGVAIDLSFVCAAYVNENHPQVHDILKEALECHIVPQFTGYQTEKTDDVLEQVWAVWNALQRRGIKYSDVSTTTPSKNVVSQTIRFLDQSIDSHQANCIDGSVLLASVLQKIGIKSYLVLIPGHCFLAFDTVENSTALPLGLETTLLGKDDISDVKNKDLLPEKEFLKEYDDSRKTFLAALNAGITKLQSCARKLQSGDDPLYALISIEEYRKKGIMPIPFAKEK
ncbi:hypothetical protein [Prosthecobacter sp.]|uniref:hypothetical protein n=1 Tax=Prosthecobacter sp. TaxID=1965333 RepID=UPI00378405F7